MRHTRTRARLLEQTPRPVDQMSSCLLPCERGHADLSLVLKERRPLRIAANVIGSAIMLRAHRIRDAGVSFRFFARRSDCLAVRAARQAVVSHPVHHTETLVEELAR